jgi:hypothetical protein
MKEWRTKIEVVHQEQSTDTMEESRQFAPLRRVAYPRITILDDGSSTTGEVVRLRKDSFTFGRTDGDITFPPDGLMSSRHCRIYLKQISERQWAWTLEDLKSRHGVFLRCPEIFLTPGMEILVGGTKLRIHGERTIITGVKQNLHFIPYIADESELTKNPSIELCSFSLDHQTTHIDLPKKSVGLGRCSHPCFHGDTFLEPTHIEITRCAPTEWNLIDKKTLNGTFLRIQSTLLHSKTEFQIGEQRILFEPSDP